MVGVNERKEIREYIKQITLDSYDSYKIKQDDFYIYSTFQKMVTSQISQHKKVSKSKTIDFYILQRPPKELWKQGFLNLFVIGNFRKDFMIIYDVADTLSYFYLEMKILPVIRPISYKSFSENIDFYKRKIKGGIRIYEKNDLQRNSREIY